MVHAKIDVVAIPVTASQAVMENDVNSTTMSVRTVAPRNKSVIQRKHLKDTSVLTM